jgi:hypothetical protein
VPVGEQVQAVDTVQRGDVPGAVRDLGDLALQDARVPDHPAGERAVLRRAPGQQLHAVGRVGAAEHPVHPDARGRLDRAQLVRLAGRHHLEHDLQAVAVRGVADVAQHRHRLADVLEADVPQAGPAQLLVHLPGPVDGAIVLGQHEDELDHRELP